jgi:hypothetical protein
VLARSTQNNFQIEKHFHFLLLLGPMFVFGYMAEPWQHVNLRPAALPAALINRSYARHAPKPKRIKMGLPWYISRFLFFAANTNGLRNLIYLLSKNTQTSWYSLVLTADGINGI